MRLPARLLLPDHHYVVDDASGCWVWKGTAGNHGYGRVRMGSRMVLAHRHSFEMHVGPIADGMFVCHTCDNKLCVNPSHLFEGTPADNSRDMASKGRSTRGTRHALSKINDHDVREIRRLYSSGRLQREIAAAYGLTQSQVGNIVRRTRWRHVV